MKEAFEKVYGLMQKNHEYSLWVKQTSLKDHALELQKEVQEAIDEIDKGDHENFRKELGDIFWDLLKLIVHSERKGWFDVREMLEEVYDKFNRRKPFLVEGREVTLEEEWRFWNEAKLNEKQKEKQDG